MSDEHIERLIDTPGVVDHWGRVGSRLDPDHRTLIVDAVKQRASGGAASDIDLDLDFEEISALRHVLRARLDAVAPAADLVDVQLQASVAVDAVVSDAAGRRVAALEATALVDPLTGLGNRRAAQLAFDAALAFARRRGTSVAVALADLDGLKRINDRAGHAAGDATLRGFATALRASMRADDGAFRFGGDEFVVLAPATTGLELARLFERMRGDAPPFTVGIAEAPVDGDTEALLISVADARMYEQRQRGAAPATASTSGRRVASGSRRWRRTVALAAAILVGVIAPVLALATQPQADRSPPIASMTPTTDTTARSVDVPEATSSSTSTSTSTTVVELASPVVPTSAALIARSSFVGAPGSAAVESAPTPAPSTTSSTTTSSTTTTTIDDPDYEAADDDDRRKPRRDKPDRPKDDPDHPGHRQR